MVEPKRKIHGERKKGGVGRNLKMAWNPDKRQDQFRN